MLKTKNSNPNSNPTLQTRQFAKNIITIFALNPKQIMSSRRFIIFHFLKQTNFAPPQDSKNHMRHLGELSTQWHSIELLGWTITANLKHFSKQWFFLNQPTFWTYRLLTYSLVDTHNAPKLFARSPTWSNFLQFRIPKYNKWFCLIGTSFVHCT